MRALCEPRVPLRPSPAAGPSELLIPRFYKKKPRSSVGTGHLLSPRVLGQQSGENGAENGLVWWPRQGEGKDVESVIPGPFLLRVTLSQMSPASLQSRGNRTSLGGSRDCPCGQGTRHSPPGLASDRTQQTGDNVRTWVPRWEVQSLLHHGTCPAALGPRNSSPFPLVPAPARV
ncbi:hypothetical protein H1C71_032867 [Ictidomys tridecemlineatus]|nr:hypothetical protein H1C71_032867 [Ictidomys tridecemlineatus]